MQDSGPHVLEWNRFYMEHMEECMGGKHPGMAFNLKTYEARMREYDAEIDAELSNAAAKVGNTEGPYKNINAWLLIDAV